MIVYSMSSCDENGDQLLSREEIQHYCPQLLTFHMKAEEEQISPADVCCTMIGYWIILSAYL
jgi:hypothetical protein